MKYILSAFLLVTLLCLGCSSANNPVTEDSTMPGSMEVSSLPVGITDYFPDGTPSQGAGAIGVFNFYLETEKPSAELTPIRNSALTDVLEIVDISNFLQLAPCGDCAKIQSVSLDIDGNLVVTIGIKHPFGVGDPLKPVTGRNRADLHVFNIEGTIVSNSTSESYPGLGRVTSDVGLLNADGYSPYLDAVLDDIYPTDADIHPYVLHFDDYSAGNFDPSSPTGFTSVTDPPPSGNLVMAMGSDYNYQDYVFEPGNGTFEFIYAIGCTYAVSAANKAQRFTPEYRIPQHNKKAASEVSVVVVSNELNDREIDSSAEIEIHVVDISHGIEVGDGLDQMLADSSVDDIFIELPGVISSLDVIDGNNPVSGTGHDPTDPLIYTTMITNELLASAGNYNGLVKVTDTYPPGQNTSPLLNCMDGIKRVDPLANPLEGIFDITEFATYATFSLDVVEGNASPVAILISDPDPATIEQLETVSFDGSTSYDPDGTITLYEFDLDWDGVESNFVADESNTTGLLPDVQFVDFGDITVGLRVTDDFGDVDYDSVVVSVSEITDIIYVDDSNTSGNEDGSQAYPYNTIAEGLAAATAGYQVWVDDSGNEYNEAVTTKTDVVLRSINWDNSDGTEMAFINSLSSGYAVRVSAQSTIDGFKISGNYDNGLYFNGMEGIVRNCWITNINGDGGIVTVVRVGSNSAGSVLEDTEISNCTLHTSSGGIINGIYCNAPITIRRCTMHDINKTEDAGIINLVYISGVVPQSGYHMEVRNNKFYDINFQSAGFINGLYITRCNQVDVYNNAFYDWNAISSGGLFGTYISGSDTAPCTDINIINNIFHDFEWTNYNYGISAGYMGSDYISDITWKNNIISYFHSGSTPIGYANYGTPPNLTWDYNDIYNLGTLTHPPGTGNINADPIFVDDVNFDFHLDTGSPCIDTGDPAIDDPDNTRSDMGIYGGPGGDDWN